MNHAIEQVKSWNRYFNQFPAEKSRIFGAVSRFRFVLVAGRRDGWEAKSAARWRSFHNNNSDIEIHSTDIFYDAIDHYFNFEENFWSFEENPISLNSKDLEENWSACSYIEKWRNLLT